MLEAAVRRPHDLSEAEVDAWRSFRASEPAFRNPLLGPEFARLVGQVRDDARVAVIRRDGRPVGFLAFHRRPSGFCQPIGSTFSDYQALVCAPDESLDGRTALAAAGVSALGFTGLIDPKGAFPGLRTSELEGFVIEPEPDAEAYYAGLRDANPKRFKNWRRLQNKLEREWGEIQITADERSPEVLEQLIAWKREQFHRTGSHDVFRPDWTRALFQAVFEGCEGARPVLVSMRAGGKLVAGHFGMAVGEDAHGWLSVINPDSAGCGPGQTLAFQTAGILKDIGLRSYDLSPGYAHYKAPFATRTLQVLEGLASAEGRTGAAGRSVDAAWAFAGEGRIGAVSRLRRRLDHIAAAELTVGGRVRGVVEAIAGYGRRASTREPQRVQEDA